MKKISVWLMALFLISSTSLYAQTEGKRIVGGYQSSSQAWPWMALIVDSSYSDLYDGFFCGGSLIHSHWVMTAAHCVKISENSNLDLEPSDIDVVLNIHNLQTETGDRVKVKRIVVHPQYDNLSDTDDFDIALIELDRDLSYRTLSLISDDSGLEGKTATVIGWGATNPKRDDHMSAQLMEVQIPIVSNIVCNQAFNKYGSDGPNPITDQMLCAGKSGKDSCYGDSGGPLMIQDSAGNWKGVGIVSWGDTVCAENNLYGVYARVSSFKAFISRYVPPEAPKLQITLSGTQVNISWSSVPDAQGYTFFYAPYPNASYISSADMKTLTGGVADLWKGAAFYVAIQAYNAAGASSYSNIEFFTIK